MRLSGAFGGGLEWVDASPAVPPPGGVLALRKRRFAAAGAAGLRIGWWAAVTGLLVIPGRAVAGLHWSVVPDHVAAAAVDAQDARHQGRRGQAQIHPPISGQCLAR